jgi:hypothetical protein
VKLHVVDERQRAGPVARVGNRPRRHRIETQIVRSGVQNISSLIHRGRSMHRSGTSVSRGLGSICGGRNRFDILGCLRSLRGLCYVLAGPGCNRRSRTTRRTRRRMKIDVPTNIRTGRIAALLETSKNARALHRKNRNQQHLNKSPPMG